MAYPLRYNTASQEVPLGYFLDSTDGNSEETGLTIANTDIKLHKCGATSLASKNSGGGTHISNGIYYAVLDATDTNTLGGLVIFCHVSGALAVRLECVVFAQAVYDALHGSGNLPADVLAISGDATAADNCESAFDGTGYAGGTVKQKVDLETIKTQAVTCAAGVTVLGSVGTASTSTAQTGDTYARLGAPAGASIAADLAAAKGDTAAILVDTGTDGVVVAAASKTGYSLSAAGVQAIWDALTSALTTVGSIGKKLADWTILTAAAAADAIWDEALSGHTGAGSAGLALSGATAPSAAAVADAVWDEAISGHLTSGTTGAALNAAGSAGDPWSTPIPGSYGAGTAGKILGDNVNATISSRSSHSAADVWAATTRALTDKAGFSLSSSGIQAIWDALTSALTTVGSIGKKLADWTIGTTQTADVASRPTLAQIEASAVLAKGAELATVDTVVDGIATTLGSAGAGLTSIPNPAGVTTLLSRVPDTISLANINAEVDTALNTAIPGSPTANSINERVKAIDDKLPSGSIGDATAANQATIAGYIDTEVAAIKAKTDLIPASPAATGDIPSAASVADAVWDEALSGHTGAGSAGLALSSASAPSAASVADAVWDEALSGHTGAGSAGLALSSASAPSAAAVADAVWDETISGHLTSGTTGAALSAAGASGDPWETQIPGSYGAGTAGKILGDNVNATISSRSSHSAADVWAATTRALTDKAGFALSSSGIQAIWDALTSALTTVGSIGKKLADWTIGTTQTADVASRPTLAQIEASAVLAKGAELATVDTVVDGIATTLGSAGAGLTSIPNPAGVTTLLSRVPDTISLVNINAEVDTALNTAIPGSPTANSINERVKAIDDKLPSGSIGDATAANQATIAGYIDTEVAAIKAKTDLIPASPAATGDAMALTVAERAAIADKILGRNIAGGTDGGRDVTSALRPLRNKVSIVNGLMTVTREDDTTQAWAATVATDAAADPITEVDPS